MENKEILIYVITGFSLLALIYLFISSPFNYTNTSNSDTTGDVISESDNIIKIGDKLNKEITISLDSTKIDSYGVVILTKDDKPLATETFNLRDIPRKQINQEQYSINLGDLIDYSFEEAGVYESFFSIPDLDVNVQTEFEVR